MHKRIIYLFPPLHTSSHSPIPQSDTSITGKTTTITRSRPASQPPKYTHTSIVSIATHHNIQYISLLMDWVEALINDESLFPPSPGLLYDTSYDVSPICASRNAVPEDISADRQADISPAVPSVCARLLPPLRQAYPDWRGM